MVTHHANLRIIEAVVRQLDLPTDTVIARDVIESGNTSAASIPIALAKLVERGELPSGARGGRLRRPPRAPEFPTTLPARPRRRLLREYRPPPPRGWSSSAPDVAAATF